MPSVCACVVVLCSLGTCSAFGAPLGSCWSWGCLPVSGGSRLLSSWGCAMFLSFFARGFWFLSGLVGGVGGLVPVSPSPCAVSSPYGCLSVRGCSLARRLGVFAFVGGHVFDSGSSWFWLGRGSGLPASRAFLLGPRALFAAAFVCAFRGWR